METLQGIGILPLSLGKILEQTTHPIIKPKLFTILRQVGLHKTKSYTAKEIVDQVKKKHIEMESLPVTHLPED